MKVEPFTIGEVAADTGLTHRALRFYEDRGLLRPVRHGKSRLYTEACVRRARRIVELTSYGFTLVEIATLIDRTERETMPALAKRLVEMRDEANQLRAAEETLAAELHRLEDRWAA